jgi:hypothetical protein
MYITAAGYLLLPLCCFYCLSPGALLVLLQAASVLGAAAAVVVSGAGMAPALLPACLFVASMALQALLGAELPNAGRIIHLLSPMLLLGLYALLSALVLPNLFDSILHVWPEKPVPPINLPVVLHPNSANMTQSVYFAVNFSLLCTASLYLAPRPTALARQLSAFLLCGYAICLISLWQLANTLAGVPFPETFFYSNPGWTILAHQGLGGVPRISGPFTEPAGLAFPLCGTVFACAWLVLRGHRHRLVGPLLPLSLICLLLSTSTSAYVALAIGLVLATALIGFKGIPHSLRQQLRMALPIGILAALSLAALLVLQPRISQGVTTVLMETLDKGNTSSFESRTTADRDSLALVLPTYGLGAGLGSNRSSSLVAGLVATMGVPGVALPLWFIIRLYRQLQIRPVHPAPAAIMARDAFSAATLGSLLVALVSGPMIVSPEFFMVLSGLVAAIAQLNWPARAPAPAGLRAARYAALALTLGCLAAAPAHAEEQPFIAGVGTHFAQAPQTSLLGLSQLRKSAFTSLRDEVYWEKVETLPGYLAVPLHWTQFIDDAQSQGLQVLLVLDYGNRLYDHGDKPRSPPAIAAFARYAGTLAAKFRGKVRFYEVWNEWNNGLGHTTPSTMQDYLPLLHASSAAIRAADPHAHVLADGILWSDGKPGVFAQAVQAGALRDADGVTLHPYFYNRGTDHRPEAWASYVQDVETQMRAANGDKQVTLYITEVGWPSSTAPGGISPALQAAYAARVYLLSKTMPFVAGLWWYDLRDDGVNPGNDQENFGLVRHDFTPKPAFTAVTDWLKHVAAANYMRPIANPPDNVSGLVFQGPNKRPFRAIWSSDDAPHVITEGGRTLAISAMPLFLEGDGQ